MRRSISPAQVEAEVAALGGLVTAALRQRWQALTGNMPADGLKGELLRVALAHRLQEQAFGGLRRDLQPRLAALASAEEAASAEADRRPRQRRIKPGSRLLREWQGRMHEVVVTPEGYLWQGEAFGSLSTIALRITGTHWNGWRFFGIDQRRSIRNLPDAACCEPGHGGRRKERKEPGPTASGIPSAEAAVHG